MTSVPKPVPDHHDAAARMWGAGGRWYDDVSFAISDALAHAAQRLDAKPGDQVLDIATGTGWTARNIARTGALVTAVDIARPLLDAARDLSAHILPPIHFEQANCEALPYGDASFDKAISTFGAMFAFDQQQAAAEMARVIRPGGRLVLAVWPPGGAVAEFFSIISQHDDAPPPPVSPLAWGDPEHARSLLGKQFDLVFEDGTNHAYHASCNAIWDWYVRGFGPLKQLSDSLDSEAREVLKQDVDAYHAHYAVPAGLHVVRDYKLIIGTRRR